MSDPTATAIKARSTRAARRTHWTERAERIQGSCNMLMGHVAEDDHGYLWVPSGNYRDWWDRRLNLWRPTHWPHYLRSRLTGQLGMIERG